MEPGTLTYQPGAQSGQGHTCEAEQALMDHVHELSGGKITLEPAWGQSNAGSLEASTAFVTDAVAKLQDNGGDIARLEADANDAHQDAVDGLREKTLASDALDGEDAANRLDEAYEKWLGIAQEEGHEDTGDCIGFADGNADDPLDLTSFGERMFEEICLPHRPE